MRSPGLLAVVMGSLLAACAGSGALSREDAPPVEELVSWEEGCAEERGLVLACREEDQAACGFFRCRDVEPREVLLA
ncbi:MAG: hypothetical protein ABW123_30115, partial [Cystobacter sp.]